VKLQSASEKSQELQNDLPNTVEARQQLDAQLSEDELVKKVCTFLTSIEGNLDTVVHCKTAAPCFWAVCLRLPRLLSASKVAFSIGCRIPGPLGTALNQQYTARHKIDVLSLVGL
jgi:hypothetical protein